jgi:hypothetical protein
LPSSTTAAGGRNASTGSFHFPVFPFPMQYPSDL